jgi:DNA-binding IclR family transcriptional regulator
MSLLWRLECEGYVSRGHDRRRRYRPTMRVVALAGQVVERAELTGIAALMSERCATTSA